MYFLFVRGVVSVISGSNPCCVGKPISQHSVVVGEAFGG